jgi:hypothetical protein
MKHWLVVGLVLCAALSAHAQGVVTVQTPANNSSVTSPVAIHATYNGTATYMKLWIDHVAITYTDNTNVFTYSATLATGAHLLEVQAQDATSKTVYTTPVNITVTSGTTTPSVTVQTPANNSTDTSPVAVHATYSGTASYMKLWIDHVSVAVTDNTSVFTYSATLANGAHLLEMQAQDATSKTVYTTPVNITVVSAAAVSVSPSSASVVQGQTQQFTASGATGTVTWSISPSGAGTISSSGLYTAGSTTGAVTITAADSGTGKSGTATANVAALAISPSTVSVTVSSTQTFTSNAPVVWTVGAGSISPSGTASSSATFTAPSTTGAVTITGTETSSTGTFTATATANVGVAPIVITPKSVTVVEGEQQQFSSSDSNATWSVSPTSAGTIDNTGLFTAGATPEGATVTATDSSTTATGSANVTISALAITPNPASVAEGATINLTANAPSTWAVSGTGSITNTSTAATTAIYTAAASAGTDTVTATEAATTTITATDTVNISALTVTPSTANTVEGQTQQFSANATVSWTASCGSISSSGLFTAPNVVEQCIITATESGTSITATATDNVTAPPPTNLNYTTWKNDNLRTGQQPNETTLTPSNVNSSTFGVLFSVTTDGMAYAQPLYMSGLTVNGSKHNVVFVATEHDSVYAFDADTSGSALWKTSFLINGATTVPPGNVGSTISTEVGITGTPVIDPSTGTLFVCAETLESGTYVHRLHALDVTTGKEKFGGPVVISASAFTAKTQLQRPGLAFANGNVYITFGSQGDNGTYHGFVIAYSATTLKQVAVWNDTPSGSEGGIWMGGAAPAVDSNGDVYVSIGNGSFNKTTQFGMSVVKLSPSLSVLDYFAPYNEATQSKSDKDVGSGGVLAVPDQSGAVPHELIACGKLPQIYVLNRDNMGHQGASSDSQIVQEPSNIVGGTSGRQAGDHCFMTAAYWNGYLYFAGNNDVLKQFTLDPSTGLMSTTPTAEGSFEFVFPGGQPVTSSNGSSDGIAWVVDAGAPAQLHAYDATDVSKALYTSPTLVTEKWAVPTVVNGKVYVAGKGKLFVFGLF